MAHGAADQRMKEAGGAALVLGASGGLGAAFAEALAASGRFEAVRALSRRADGFDITDEAAVSRAAGLLAGGAPLRLVVCATGVLSPRGARPEKSLAGIDPAVMAEAFAVNAIGPALVFKHFAPLLAAKGRSVFACLSARVGSIGDNRLGGWTSYRASKAALNQVVRCASVEIARTRPEAVIAALHPGTVETALSRPYARGRFTHAPAEAAARMLAVLDGLSPAQSGGFFAYDGTQIPW